MKAKLTIMHLSNKAKMLREQFKKTGKMYIIPKKGYEPYLGTNQSVTPKGSIKKPTKTELLSQIFD